MLEAKEEDLHERNIRTLIQEHGNLVDPEFIREVYSEILSSHEGATVREFIPLLVMKEVKEALSQKYLNIGGLK